MKRIEIDRESCVGCEACVDVCLKNALSYDKKEGLKYDPEKCEGCGECITACPSESVKYKENEKV